MADGVVHRQVLQNLDAVVRQRADALGGANPHPVVDVFHLLHGAQRLNVYPFKIGEIVAIGCVIEPKVAALKPELARLRRIGEHGGHALHGAFLRAEEADQLAVPDLHQIAEIGQAIDDPVASHPQIAHVRLGDGLILHHPQVSVRVDYRDAAGRGDVDRVALVSRDGAGVRRQHAVQLAPLAQLAPLQHRDAVVVGADPQAIPAVHIQALDAGDAAGGIHAHEGVAVVADQSAVAADPDEALRGLHDGVGFRGGQAVGVVIQHRREVFGLVDRIHGACPVGARRTHIQQKDKDKVQVQTPRPVSSVSRILCHAETFLPFVIIRINSLEAKQRARLQRCEAKDPCGNDSYIMLC